MFLSLVREESFSRFYGLWIVALIGGNFTDYFFLESGTKVDFAIYMARVLILSREKDGFDLILYEEPIVGNGFFLLF